MSPRRQMIAVPLFGGNSHISLDRRFGSVRETAVTASSAVDWRRLRYRVGPENTCAEVWATSQRLEAIACRPVDTACPSLRNERGLADRMLASRIHRRKPAGEPLPKRTRPGQRKSSEIRTRIEQVFLHQ